MAARKRVAQGPADPVETNEVRLVGRLAAEPEVKELPSGDRLTSFRIVVARPAGGPSRQRVDAIECAAWTARVRRSAAGWRPGDVVEVQGAVRRRFFRTGAGAASRVEVEASSARVIRRATTA
jgi:single-strand DNA-binding protein